MVEDAFGLAICVKSIGASCLVELRSEFDDWMMNVIYIPYLRGRIRALALFVT